MVFLLGFIPFLFFALSAALFHSFEPSKEQKDIRWSLVKAGLVTGVWCFLGTEILSLGKLLRLVPLTLWWGIPSVLTALLVYKRRASSEKPAMGINSKIDWALFGGVIIILIIIGFIGLITPPNNYDSQEYHLPRQFAWMQQGHIGTFAANDERQLSMPPFAEFAGVHLMILSRSDFLPNTVQWFALALIAVVVSLIAQTLGCGTRGQCFAALFSVSYPTAALQAINTKNDVVTAFFVCAAALVTAQIVKDKNCPWGRACILGSAIGLAMLTKGTGMVFVIPISFFAGIALLWIHRGKGLMLGAVISLITISINAPHIVRNYTEFHSPFGRPQNKGGYSLRNDIHSPAALLSNVSRNIAMHLTFFPASDRILSNSVARLHGALGIDLNDERTTHMSKFEVANPYKSSEDQSRAPLHMVLALVTFGLLLWPGTRLPRWIRCFCLLPFAAFLIFCFEIKWQIWHNRLQISLFCLLAPVTALLFSRHRNFTAFAGIILFLLAIPLVSKSQAKSLFGRRSIFLKTNNEIRFMARPEMRPALEWVETVCHKIKPKVVALHAQPHSWVYPVQRMVHTLPNQPVTFLLQPTFGKAFAITNLEPDMIVAVDQNLAQRRRPPTLKSSSGRSFDFFAEFASLRIYLPSGSPIPNLIPPFYGWTTDEGLAATDGPFPQHKLPSFRAGNSPVTKLFFVSDGSARVLSLSARSQSSQPEPFVIEFNSVPLLTNVLLNTEFHDLAISLPTIRGTNEVRLLYPSASESNRIFYKQLQIK